MASFRIALTMLTVCGCLRPATWTSSFKKFVYLVYSVLAYCFVQTLMLSNLLEILENVRNHEDFSEVLNMMTSVTGSICKMTTILMNQKNIVTLVNFLRREPFLPVDEEEMDIKNRLDKLIDMNSIQYMGAIQIALFIAWISTLIMEGKNRQLTFRAWFPYDYSSPTLYAVTYLYQFVATTYHTVIHVACDTLFSGMLICIYGQLEILGHRLQRITNDERKSVIKCAQHHHQLYVYAANVNKTFQLVIFIQMLMSMSMVCFTIYQLAQTQIVAERMNQFMNMFCQVLQIFFYCWYGNEVKLKSLELSDMIFAGNWIGLDKNTKKTLLMIMLRSTFPIEITTAHIVYVNVESFMSLIKSSYSAYNLLA